MSERCGILNSPRSWHTIFMYGPTPSIVASTFLKTGDICAKCFLKPLVHEYRRQLHRNTFLHKFVSNGHLWSISVCMAVKRYVKIHTLSLSQDYNICANTHVFFQWLRIFRTLIILMCQFLHCFLCLKVLHILSHDKNKRWIQKPCLFFDNTHLLLIFRFIALFTVFVCVM